MNNNTTKIQVTLSSNHNQSNARANFPVPGRQIQRASGACMSEAAATLIQHAAAAKSSQPAKGNTYEL
jgi:hypothetical protein